MLLCPSIISSLASEPIIMFQLANSKKYVTVGPFQGNLLVDIRKYYIRAGPDGKEKLLPGQPGIALTVEQWRSLKTVVDAVDASIAEYEHQNPPQSALPKPPTGPVRPLMPRCNGMVPHDVPPNVPSLLPRRALVTPQTYSPYPDGSYDTVDNA